jgi:hypothetical protein
MDEDGTDDDGSVLVGVSWITPIFIFSTPASFQ